MKCGFVLGLFAIVVAVLAIGIAWPSSFEVEFELTVDGKLDDVFAFMSNPENEKKVHPLL